MEEKTPTLDSEEIKKMSKSGDYKDEDIKTMVYENLKGLLAKAGNVVHYIGEAGAGGCLFMRIEESSGKKSYVKAGWDEPTINRVQKNIKYFNRLPKDKFSWLHPCETTTQPSLYYLLMNDEGRNYEVILKGAEKDDSLVATAYLLNFFGVSSFLDELEKNSGSGGESNLEEKVEIVKPEKNLLSTLITADSKNVTSKARDYLRAAIKRDYEHISELKELASTDKEKLEFINKIERKLGEYKTHIDDICGSRTPVVVCPSDTNPSNFVGDIKFHEKKFGKSARWEGSVKIIDQVGTDEHLVYGPLPFSIGCFLTYAKDVNMPGAALNILCDRLKKAYIGKWDDEKGVYTKSPEFNYWTRAPKEPDSWCRANELFDIGSLHAKVAYLRNQYERFAAGIKIAVPVEEKSIRLEDYVSKMDHRFKRIDKYSAIASLDNPLKAFKQYTNF